MSVKGSWKRPSSVSELEATIRWDYAFRPQGEAHLTWEEWLNLKGIDYVTLCKGKLQDEVGG